MKSFRMLSAWAISLLGLVSAHGGGMEYTINGFKHRGNFDLLHNSAGSIQRAWNWSASEYLSNPAMACGYDGSASPGSYHAPLEAGSTISVNYSAPLELGEAYWTDHGEFNEDVGGKRWRWAFGHTRGPMAAYLAPCPDAGCEGVDLHAPMWVKIWEAGLLSGDWIDGRWAMYDVFFGAPIEIPTPKSLKPGKYLLRHEMNNLINGGQWFPNCIQLEVSGQGTKSLPTEEGMAVSFGVAGERDAYMKDDGPNGSFCTSPTSECGGSTWFYGPAGRQTLYPMPGPPVWQG